MLWHWTDARHLYANIYRPCLYFWLQAESRLLLQRILLCVRRLHVERWSSATRLDANVSLVCMIGSRWNRNCKLESNRPCNRTLSMLDDYMSKHWSDATHLDAKIVRVCGFGCRRRRDCTVDASRDCNDTLFMLEDYMSNTGQTWHIGMVILSLFVFFPLGGVALARSITILIPTKPCSLWTITGRQLVRRNTFWLLILSVFVFLARLRRNCTPWLLSIAMKPCLCLTTTCRTLVWRNTIGFLYCPFLYSWFQMEMQLHAQAAIGTATNPCS
jgi:hypothetical protein